MAYTSIGNTVVEWDDREPLCFTMREETGPRDHRETRTVPLNLTKLRNGYSENFLLHLKSYLVERRNAVSLGSVLTEARRLQSLFGKLIDLEFFDNEITLVDESFLLSVASRKEELDAEGLLYLRMMFKFYPDIPLFAKGLVESDFPTIQNKRATHGAQIDRILGKAMSRAAVVRILNACDAAYADGRIDIGHYSYVHLAFAVYVRPNSYRQIRVSDFWFDDKKRQYFIWIVTSKTGEEVPSKVLFNINEPMGILLTKQRQHVIATYGHLVAEGDIGNLALFPARQLKAGGSTWHSDYARNHFGMYESSQHFGAGYARAIRKALGDHITLSANALRHTVGTLLAQTGASAKTIQAVLKHATDNVCKAYVDIAFHGLMEELSDAMSPAFEGHIPALIHFRSKREPVPTEKLIQSEDLQTGALEDTGECGKSIACANAPIVCYGCFRFIPCWDADHSVNLRIVEREIEDMSARGKPFEHMVDRARTAKNQIIVIMHAADRYRDAMRPEAAIEQAD